MSPKERENRWNYSFTSTSLTRSKDNLQFNEILDNIPFRKINGKDIESTSKINFISRVKSIGFYAFLIAYYYKKELIDLYNIYTGENKDQEL